MSSRDLSRVADSQLELSRSEESSSEDEEEKKEESNPAKRQRNSEEKEEENNEEAVEQEVEDEKMEVDNIDDNEDDGQVEEKEVIENDKEENTNDGFEIVNEADCITEQTSPKFNAEILFEESEPDEQFLVEKRLPNSEHKKELQNACHFYADSEGHSVSTAVKQAFKIQSTSNTRFPRIELPDENIKAKRWVKRTHVRHDGMKRVKWEREVDEFINDPALFPRNPEHKDILNLTDEEYIIYFRKLDLEQMPSDDIMEERKIWPKEIGDSKRQWTLEETRYLISLYHKYTTRWSIIADQYNYKGLQPRSLYEIKTRFFFVFDLMCFVRDKRHLMSDYDPELEYATRKKREITFKITPKTQNRIATLEKELMEISPADLEPPPRPPPIPDAPAAAAVQKSVTTGRSSSSVPPSRMPSVPKYGSRANLDQTIDYKKKIEAASDISFLRFFNSQSAGPHLRSQEYRLVSNVNPKKRGNIENVIEGLGLLRRTVYNERIAKFYTKLSTNINVISELKAVYSIASAECQALHNEYCEKSGTQIKLEIPPLPQSAEGKPSICSLCEAPGQSSLNRKRI